MMSNSLKGKFSGSFYKQSKFVLMVALITISVAHKNQNNNTNISNRKILIKLQKQIYLTEFMFDKK